MDDQSRTHVTKGLTHSGPFPLSAVTSARLPQVTTPPGSLEDRGKTSCPQQLAQPRTTRDHQQGNGRRLKDAGIEFMTAPTAGAGRSADSRRRHPMNGIRVLKKEPLRRI